MNLLMLAAEHTMGPTADTQTQQIQELHANLVDKLPPGAFGLMLVMVALTLIAAVWIVFAQRRLAANQVKTAELIAQHLAMHEAHEAEHARHAAEHSQA